MLHVALSALLHIGNLFLSSANVIVAFSLLAYIASHNLRSPVAQAFCALITCVLIVFAGDVVLDHVDSLDSAVFWLRLQWLGIAFVPAAYLHFSDALLRTTGASSRWRSAVIIGYLLGAAAFVLAAFTDLIVQGGSETEGVFRFHAGPLFWAFSLYYFAVTLSGVLNIHRARNRCLTSTSRRRMGYLALAFAAPGVGVFPYLLSTTMAGLPVTIVLALTLVANLAVVLMTIVIGYIVAYQGVLLPDRVVKHSLLHYLLRGPLVGTAMLVLILVIPSVERILGIDRDTVLIFAIVVSSVLFQVIIALAKPAIDRLVYRKDRDEITWFQELDKRLLTSTDLEQILENVLVALCDLLRVPSGFVVTTQGDALHLRVSCGRREPTATFLSRTLTPGLIASLQTKHRGEELTESDFVTRNGHTLLPLHSRDGKTMMGILGFEGWEAHTGLRVVDPETVVGLVHHMEMALDDMRLQQEVFAILRGMEPEIEQLQRLGSTPRYARAAGEGPAPAPLYSPDFVTLVKDALSHYWGGPKLSRSPLLGLSVVKSALAANDGVPAKALRATLREAIERLRPDSERNLATNEWIVYNILDYRYLRGDRIREIAARLAMSESDFYRKQRVAIEEVAKTLLAMEEENRAARQSRSDPPSST